MFIKLQLLKSTYEKRKENDNLLSFLVSEPQALS